MRFNGKQADEETKFGCFSLSKEQMDLEKERARGMRESHWYSSSTTTEFPTCSQSPAVFPAGSWEHTWVPLRKGSLEWVWGEQKVAKVICFPKRASFKK